MLRSFRHSSFLAAATVYDRQDVEFAGYCVANVTLSALRLLPRTELSLSAYNATGKRYADVAGPAFVQTALAREGRTLAAKLDWRF
ncbi:hypothetical protein ACEN88_04575, partial [Massilia sp. CT11-108]